MTLFSDRFGKFLKKISSKLDKILAIRRSSLGEENFSLYPRKKNMGFIAKIMEENLEIEG